MTRRDARLSTYSGAPSLQPSLDPTHADTSSTRSSVQHYNLRSSEQYFIMPTRASEKGSRQFYANGKAASSSLTLSSTDPKTAEIKSFANAFDKMTDKRLDKQRFVMSNDKTEEVGKIALGAKLERALSRRMVGQDATFRPRSKKSSLVDEKRALEVEAV